MRKLITLAIVVIAIGVGFAAVGLVYVMATGLSARPVPGPFETRLARFVRGFAVPGDVKARVNPVPASDEHMMQALEHFADHCASCHANDGSGNTDLGRGFFPKAPDMRLAATQSLTDGELFYIIENGVRFTGMPAWSTGTPDGETASWELVHFIRRLPRLTPGDLERMQALNPRSPEEIRQEIDEERFLRGDDVSPAP
jgi:mono/diheme cytochrome c family protein